MFKVRKFLFDYFQIATESTTYRSAKADRIAANMLLPWILVTWIIIIFNIVAGVIFALDLEDPFKVQVKLISNPS